MILPIQYSTTCLTLLAVCFVLMSVGCGDSDDDEDLIEEGAEPLVVTIIDKWSDDPPVPERSEAEILADIILERETEDFYFDIAQRNRLIGEIEGVLSLIRAAYPSMTQIHTTERSASVPGMLVIDLEPDFSETLKERFQDKEGQIRFETGNAEFDALNAMLGLQNVILSRDLYLYFDRHLNLRTAIEAYSKVEGVRWVRGSASIGEHDTITASKQGATWYVIFKHGWGDCPSGCPYKEFFCFTVRGTDVELIPTAQAQTMPPFQALNRSLHNQLPFFNATAYNWSWRGNRYTRAADNNLGCSLFGDIESFPNLLSVSCSYRMESLPREDIGDYDFTGVVLLLIATQERLVIGKSRSHSSVVASETVLAAKTAAEIEQPEHVYFENVLMPINPPPPSAEFERWWGGVHPTFVVCWDHTEIDLRAYQFIEPNFRHASRYEASNQPNCDKIRDTDYIQILDVPSGVPFVSLPLREVYDEIDEVLPRP